MTGASPWGPSPGGLAILIAGQGAQHAGMFDILRGHETAEAILAEAASLLGGRDPRDVAACENGDRFGNRTGQILCCAAVGCGWSALSFDRAQPMMLAGYSVGELAAWHDAVRESRARTILELGSGTALAAMARAAISEVRIHSIDDFRSLGGAPDWLKG